MIFTILLTFLGKSCNAHMFHASGVHYGYGSQGLILNSGRSYATFGTKIPVFRANSGCILGTIWQKRWIYKNVIRIVKIVHSDESESYKRKDDGLLNSNATGYPPAPVA